MVKGEICRQTDSIGSDGDGLPWLTIVLGNIKQGRVEEEAEKEKNAYCFFIRGLSHGTRVV